ncbi:hypothetical protein EZY14_009015 [Kordia sp. TARA_039_SRF]|nr:hypothetical protein EZY14_009015 [Kordia sp. TARA_039_SRF]
MSQTIYVEDIVTAVVGVLTSNNIKVESRKNDEASLRKFQKQLLRRQSLSVSEVLQGKFFPHISTANGIKHQCKTGKIPKDTGWFINSKGHYRIFTSVLEKLVV